jgi:serine/threonine-protein kinase
LESAGLVIGEVRTDHDPTIAENRATKTEPAENSEVAKGSEVILFVSDGNVELPDVTGMSEAEARAALTELGLTPDVSDVVDDSVEPGTVLDQRPTPGLVPQRSVVQLSISAQATTVQVPNVVGKSKNQAESELSAAGLSFTYGSDQFDPSIPAGSIKAQNPSGGITVDKDTTVTLTLSKGPEPAPTAPTASAAP